ISDATFSPSRQRRVIPGQGPLSPRRPSGILRESGTGSTRTPTIQDKRADPTRSLAMATGGRQGEAIRLVGAILRSGSFAGASDDELLERFRRNSDEDAFGAILDRHGAMVLSVCRNLLHDPWDAEDAFQASFLVLARRASMIRDRGSLASWLYGVALRV